MPRLNPFSRKAPPSGVATAVTQPLTVIRPWGGWRSLDLAELWQYRELVYFLAWRDIKVRYKQTAIGAAWAVLQPLCAMAIFSLVFGKLARIPTGGQPYPLFVYAGLLPWFFFANSASQAGLSLVNQSQLLTKVYFPRILIPASAVGVALVDFVVGLGVYAALWLWFGGVPGVSLLLLPVLLLLTAMAGLGVGVLLASVTIAYRDFRIAIPFMMQIGMYLSPVVYPVTLVPPSYRWLLLLNPLTGIINGFRAALLGQPLDGSELGLAGLLSALLLVIGVCQFRRRERRFADIV